MFAMSSHFHVLDPVQGESTMDSNNVIRLPGMLSGELSILIIIKTVLCDLR